MRLRMLMLCLLLPRCGFAQARPDQDSILKETNLRIFILDGFGKVSGITPVIFLSDTLSGKTAAHFTRSLDRYGQPRPQIVPAGIYDMSVGLTASQMVHHVVIAAGARNQLTVRLANGHLRFRYLDSAHQEISRPVKEYEASVSLRDDTGHAVLQRCNTELEYGPGSYSVTINSQPPMHFDAEIEIGGSATQIEFPEPGTVSFSGPPGKFEVTALIEGGPFQCPDFFLVSNTTGRPLLWRPGAYELRRVKAGDPAAAVTRFRIYAGKMTDVSLK